jgi:hypothetical protein
MTDSNKSGILARRDAVPWLRALEETKLECVQSAHFGHRTGSYIGRIGPDPVSCRGSPVFAGAGMQLESHLGHVFSLFRGLWAAECVYKSPFMGPYGAHFCWWRLVWRLLLLAWTAVLLLTPSWPGALGTA